MQSILNKKEKVKKKAICEENTSELLQGKPTLTVYTSQKNSSTRINKTMNGYTFAYHTQDFRLDLPY